jgi:hypothetical protein
MLTGGGLTGGVGGRLPWEGGYPVTRKLYHLFFLLLLFIISLGDWKKRIKFHKFLVFLSDKW